MVPNLLPRRPRAIDYSMLNEMEKRLLQRRPLNMWSVLALRKPVMRRFLRSNGQRYKTKDRKKRLMRLIIDVIRRHDLRPRTIRQAGLVPTQGQASTLRNGAPALVNSAKTKKSKLPDGVHVRGKRCKCSISLSELLNMSYQLPQLYVVELKKLLGAAPIKVEEVIKLYGGEPDPEGCNRKNLGLVRNLFVEDLLALRKTLKKEDEQTKVSNGLECLICYEENQMCITEPCGHMFCIRCATEMMNKTGNNICPHCRQRVTKHHCITIPGTHTNTEQIQPQA